MYRTVKEISKLQTLYISKINFYKKYQGKNQMLNLCLEKKLKEVLLENRWQ